MFDIFFAELREMIIVYPTYTLGLVIVLIVFFSAARFFAKLQK